MAENLILIEQELAFGPAEIEGLYLWENIPAVISLAEGEEYIIVWDGNRYSCTAVAENFNGIDCVGVGNLVLAGLGENTGEPFLFGVAADGSFSACYTTQSEEVIRVAIYQVVEEEADDVEYLIKRSSLSAIADAIRAKTGKAEAISVSGMPSQIAGITAGGGSSADVRYVTFMSYDGTVEYGKKAVALGDDCADPIARGLFGTPTRESTVQYSYTFYGWATTPNGAADANWYKSITEDKTVYANFTAAVRYYTITYYDGVAVLKTESLPYGTMPDYTPKKDGHLLTGWQPELAAVTGNASYYAQWRELAGFDKLFTLNVTKTYDVAINNAGTLMAVAAGSSATKDPLTYNISDGTPVQLAASDAGSGLIWRSVSFNCNDSELHAEGYYSDDYTHHIRSYTVTDSTALTYGSQIDSNGNSPIADSPVVDVYGGYRYQSGSKIVQYPGKTISLDGSASSIAYSPDGVHIAVATTYGASVYNYTTAELVNKPHGGALGTVKKVSYNADGSLLAVSCTAAPFVAVYETAGYTKICDLADILTAASYAEFLGNNTLVIGTGTSVLVYTVTDSGIRDFAYNVPAYTGTEVKDVVKNHNSTRVAIRSENDVEVWSYI